MRVCLHLKKNWIFTTKKKENEKIERKKINNEYYLQRRSRSKKSMICCEISYSVFLGGVGQLYDQYSRFFEQNLTTEFL